MILTYTETPNFGDPKKFEEELNIVKGKVENLSADLISLNRELDLVESKMNLNMRHSLLAAPSRSLVSLGTSTLSGGSDSTGYGSQDSNAGADKVVKVDDSELPSESENIKDSLDNETPNTEVSFNDNTVGIKGSSEILNEEGESSDRLSNDWDEEFEDDSKNLPLQLLVALYHYDGADEGTLEMQEGEEFIVTGEDVDGWIKVKRKMQNCEEGYIPFAFTQRLSDEIM